MNNASSTTTTTSVGGTAGVNWQLGPVVGVQQVRASFAGNDVTFTATAVALGPCVATPTSTDHGVFTTVSADQTWTAAGSPHLGQTVVIENATITVEAGAVVCVQVIESADPQTGRIVAEGTAVAPIRFIGTDLVAVKSLKHVRGENLKRVGRAITGHFVSALEDSNFTFSGAKLPLWCYQVAVGGNATVLRTVIAGYGAPDCAALYLGALGSETVSAQVRVFSSSGDGVRLAGNGRISLSGCELFNNAGHGIYAPLPGSTTASVNGCNITANTGDAIRTELPTPIDATGNWWGDARGPVASGVRLTGAINVGAWLTAPATVGY